MQQRLPKSIYKQFKNQLKKEKIFDLATADVIANEIREWAIGKGATHFAHLFQPLTGVTAEKQDSFITAPKADGSVLTGLFLEKN